MPLTSALPDYLNKDITMPAADGGPPWQAVFECAKFDGSAKPALTGLALLLDQIPLSAGTDKDVCLRLPGKTQRSVSGYVSYWSKRWKRKYRTQLTNQGVRIWRTA